MQTSKKEKLQLFIFPSEYTDQIRIKTQKQTNQMRVDSINTFNCWFGRFLRLPSKTYLYENWKKKSLARRRPFRSGTFYVCIAMHKELHRNIQN